MYFYNKLNAIFLFLCGERGGSVVECRTPEREVRGSRPTAAVLCPWARHFTPRKYWLITQEAMAPSRHDWKIVDWDVKPQHNQPTNLFLCSVIHPATKLHSLLRPLAAHLRRILPSGRAHAQTDRSACCSRSRRRRLCRAPAQFHLSIINTILFSARVSSAAFTDESLQNLICMCVNILRYFGDI